MLKDIWDKAVHGYQSARQSMTRDSITAIDQRIAAARQGYSLYVEHFAYGAAPMAIWQEIDAETAEKIIAEATESREKLVAAMDARRQKYNLDF